MCGVCACHVVCRVVLLYLSSREQLNKTALQERWRAGRISMRRIPSQRLRHLLGLLLLGPELVCALHARATRLPLAARACTSASASSAQDSAQLHWFVRTEQFCQPFPVVKPHLEAHRQWVTAQREAGYPVTSGYRVDAEGRPGGGGLMLFRAASHEAAVAFVAEDPLVANRCVDYQVNRWIAEVGDIELL